MHYPLAFIFIILYLWLSHVLPIHANMLSAWDLVMEPIVDFAHQKQRYDESRFIVEADLINCIKQECLLHFELPGELSLKITQPQPIISVPSSNWKVSIINFPKKLTDITHFKLGIYVDDKLYNTIDNLPVEIRLWQNCLKPKYNLFANANVSISDFEITRCNLLNFSGKPVKTSDCQGSFKLKKSLKANEVLTLDMIESLPVIVKGQTVDVILQKGLLTLNMKAIALENGKIDQFIAIKNINTNKTFQGKIINENTIQVIL